VQEYLAVEIEHSRYVKFLRVDEKDHRGLNLTTLVDDQRKAEVHIYLVDDKKRQSIHSFTVTDLPHQRAGEPRLYLSGRSDGRGAVQLALKVNGKPWSSTELSLKKYLSRRRGPLFFAGLGLLLLLILLWILLRSCPAAPKGQTSGAADTTGKTAAETTAIEDQDTEEQYSEDVEEQPAAETTAEDSGATDPAAGERDGEVADDVEADAGETTGEEAADTAAGKRVEDKEETATESQPAAPPPEAETVYFGPNSSLLTRSARDRLSSLAEELVGYRQLRISIRGHCALYGTEQGRIELSNERANTVEQYLLERAEGLGQDPSGWTVESTGLGGKEPVTRDEDRQNLNRRVEIRIERR
jgi:outer membrane protein OmpA-like peptidoglycan-associated protein